MAEQQQQAMDEHNQLQESLAKNPNPIQPLKTDDIRVSETENSDWFRREAAAQEAKAQEQAAAQVQA